MLILKATSMLLDIINAREVDMADDDQYPVMGHRITILDTSAKEAFHELYTFQEDYTKAIGDNQRLSNEILMLKNQIQENGICGNLDKAVTQTDARKSD